MTMEQLILRALSIKWETATGWEIWKYVAGERGLPAGYQTPEYRTFKQALTRARDKGLIRQWEEESLPQKSTRRKRARSYWELTDLGWEHSEPTLDEIGEETPQTSEEWVKRRITADQPVPKGVWRELMRRQKAGELDVVFVKAKNGDSS